MESSTPASERIGRTLFQRLAPLAAAVLVVTGCTIKPQPLAEADNTQRSADLLQRVVHDQEPVTGPIDLYEAMARAIKYNLDYRVELMNQAVQAKDLDLRRFDMLPKVVANLDYAGRDNYSGGYSRSLLTGRVSLEPSTSSDKDVLQSDLTMSWDVLDFGLSYVRAQQSGDEVMVAEERKRKVIHRIIEDVRSAFWRAASAERLLTKTLELESVTRSALAQAEEQAGTGLTRPMAALSYERELLSIQRDSQSLARELSVAKQQLAALMNLPPDTQYTVALPTSDITWQPLQAPYSDMLRMAIANRPELREVAYQMRSNERETTAALLRALPSLRLFLGLDWTDNSYIYNSNWTGWGARASWNLLNVFRLPADKAKIKAQGELLDARALALTMAVSTQVTVSRARYEMRLREMQTADRFYKVQQRIESQIDSGFKAQSVSRQTLIREQMNTVVAEVRFDVAQADLQNAYANVYASVGIDPIDAGMSASDSVEVLSGKLRDMWARRDDSVALTTSR